MIEIFASLLAVIWCMSAARGFSKQAAFKGYDVDISRTSEDSDFAAGCAYEESGDPAAFYFFNDTEETQAVAQPKPKPKPLQVKDHPLYEDCVDSLVSLGYNKTAAKKVANSILSNTNITSIEEFIVVAMRKS